MYLWWKVAVAARKVRPADEEKVRKVAEVIPLSHYLLVRFCWPVIRAEGPRCILNETASSFINGEHFFENFSRHFCVPDLPLNYLRFT